MTYPPYIVASYFSLMKVQARSQSRSTFSREEPPCLSSCCGILTIIPSQSSLSLRSNGAHSSSRTPGRAQTRIYAGRIKTSRTSHGQGRKQWKGEWAQGQEAQSENAGGEKTEKAQAHASKKTKTEDTPTSEDSKPRSPAIDMSKLDALVSRYGVLPLQDTSLPKQNEPTPETVLSLLYLAMLTSARISHELAYKTLQYVIEAGYHDIGTLRKSTWQERTEVLTKGGYTRYREKTATALGELAEFIGKEYDDDLNSLLKKANSSPTQVRKLLQEIKGIGKVGTDILFDAVQGIWPSLAPFIDPRSLETAKQCGLGGDVDAWWDAVGKDAVKMCKLSSALTMARLEKKEKELQ